MFRCKFAAFIIASAAYDAQNAVLEVEFVGEGQIWQYMEVPEEVWYRFRKETGPDAFFNRYIQGCYQEKRVFQDI